MQQQLIGYETNESRKKLHYIPVYKVQLVRDGRAKTYNNMLSSPAEAVDVIRDYIGDTDREIFIAVLLNMKNKLIGINTVSIGSLNSSIVHPREVLKPAMLANAASTIVAHNHPSGDPTPSREDLDVTKRLVEAGEILGIKVLDHIIIGEGRHLSFKERGYL